ncbi:uncharacterized protein LOC126661173 [Mercurialis annua]|uniref:uncharacterized protein LOC126653484 n=1 Tax=Mercurialis annua TaxID=3986 RepID=UPI00215DEABF|nr:uncharacterized protein LOC126653484 [Mercurialis annua]XP_050210943.1 uncharacterized protein LOC126661173 [Mercurialis annua]
MQPAKAKNRAESNLRPGKIKYIKQGLLGKASGQGLRQMISEDGSRPINSLKSATSTPITQFGIEQGITEGEKQRKVELERKAKLDEIAQKQRQREIEKEEKRRIYCASSRPSYPSAVSYPELGTSSVAAAAGKYVPIYNRDKEGPRNGGSREPPSDWGARQTPAIDGDPWQPPPNSDRWASSTRTEVPNPPSDRRRDGSSKSTCSSSKEGALQKGSSIRNAYTMGSNSSTDLPSDTPLPQPSELVQDNTTNSGGKNKKKKGRGRNMIKEVAGLKRGEKLNVTFYNNRAVGQNHKCFTRHLGKIIRDRQICPLNVRSWKEIPEERKNHMWDSVTEKFEADDLLDHRDDVLHHMRELWNKWRGKMHIKNVKNMSEQEALNCVPNGVHKDDWEWLVKNYYSDKKYKEVSIRNSHRRSKLTMPHRTGSKPVREIIYEMGGKEGNPPDVAVVFHASHSKNGKLIELETIEKYDEIQEVIRSEPSLSRIELVDKCFKTQNHGHVVCFGGGVKRKDLDGSSSRKAELVEENRSMKVRLSSLEEEFQKLKEMFLSQQSTNFQPPCSSPPAEDLMY